MGEVLTPEYDADEIAAWAAAAPLTEGVLTPFGQIHPEQLSQDGTLDMVIALERLKNWCEAEILSHLAYRAAHADVSPCAPPGEGERYALVSLEQELVCANRWSANQAAERLRVAIIVVSRLTATLDMLEAGRISYLHVRALAEAVGRLDDPDGTLTAKLEERVLKRAAEQNCSEFRRSIRRGVAALDPRSLEEKFAQDLNDRRVCNEPADNGMAWINAFVSAVDASTIMTAIQAVADMIKKHAKDCGVHDCRTADQLRADALTAICAAVLNGETIDGLLATNLPKWHGRRPNVNVTVAVSTLLGCDEQAGDLAGYGPIPAELARRIAADESATWHRIVTDELGHLIDYGQTVYRPPQDLQDHCNARDRECTGIGCHRRADLCDLDHITPFSEGGHTSADNLGPGCQTIHYVKQFAGWINKRNDDGSTTWTTPTDREYTKPAAEYPIDTTRPKTEPEDDHGDSAGDDKPPF